MKVVLVSVFVVLLHVSLWGSHQDEVLTKLTSIVEGLDDRNQDEALRSFMDTVWDYSMKEFPVYATYKGKTEYNDRWTDNSEEANHRRDQFDRDYLTLLKKFNKEAMSESAALDLSIMLLDTESNVEGQKFPWRYMPINQMGGPQRSIPHVMSIMPTKTDKDLENIISRLNKLPTLIEQNMMWMKQGLEKKVTPPQSTLKGLVGQFDSLLLEDLSENVIAKHFVKLENEEAKQKILKLISTKVIPAFKKLQEFIENVYIPNCRKNVAWTSLPQGKAWYQFQVEQNTTTKKSSREIHEIGISEVKRIRTEMEKLIKELKFDGDFDAFCEFLRTDPQFYYKRPSELLKGYRDISKRADSEMIKFFGILPRLPYGVEAVPDHIAPNQTTAYYRRGSIDAGRPGIFYANTYAINTRPKWEMEALTLHEAVPGHHLQIAIAQELEDLHPLRQNSHYTAYVEGWGLYAESLGEEMGFYKDPYMKFGQLTYEMWRAVRLVVDTGMHDLGWSREKAYDFFESNTPKTGHDINVELDRYIVWPGQALAYKIGELKIKELRGIAESTLGEKFSLRSFHDEVLKRGALPLDLLDHYLKAWIETKK